MNAKNIVAFASVAAVLFCAEFVGYWASRELGDLATFGLFVGAAFVGWSIGQQTSMRIVAFAVAFVLCLGLAVANLFFLRWVQLEVFIRMDEQVFGWFLPVYLWVLMVPSCLVGAVVAMVTARRGNGGND